LPPCSTKSHGGKHGEEEAGDLKDQDSRGSRSRLTNALRGSDSAPHRRMAVTEPPQHAAHGLRSLKISDLRHGFDSNNEAPETDCRYAQTYSRE
jgi:hypothetical protein